MKKKFFAILLVMLALLTAFAGCSEKKDNNQAVQDIVQKSSDWIFGDDVAFSACSYGITDLDQNGKPEVIAEYFDADKKIIYTKIYITDEKGEIKECERKTAGKTFDEAYFDETVRYGKTCYYDAEANLYYYTYTRVTRVSKFEQYKQIIAFSLNGDVITEELLATELELYNEEIEDVEYTYTDSKGNEIDENAYTNAAKNRYSDITEKTVSFGGFKGFTKEQNDELKGMSRSELEDILSKSFSKFVIG